MKHLVIALVKHHERFKVDGDYFVEATKIRGTKDFRIVARYEGSDLSIKFNKDRIVILAMRFFDVLPRLIEGKKYRRQSWVEGTYIVFEEGQRFVTLRGRTSPTRWTPYKEDFDAEDWEEVE